MGNSSFLDEPDLLQDFIGRVTYLGSVGSEPVSIQGRFETCPTVGRIVDLGGRMTVALDVGAGF